MHSWWIRGLDAKRAFRTFATSRKLPSQVKMIVGHILFGFECSSIIGLKGCYKPTSMAQPSQCTLAAPAQKQVEIAPSEPES